MERPGGDQVKLKFLSFCLTAVGADAGYGGDTAGHDAMAGVGAAVEAHAIVRIAREQMN
jgi:hypothetical protein